MELEEPVQLMPEHLGQASRTRMSNIFCFKIQNFLCYFVLQLVLQFVSVIFSHIVNIYLLWFNKINERTSCRMFDKVRRCHSKNNLVTNHLMI